MRKWYVEFPAVITIIILGMVLAWNISIPSCNKLKKGESDKEKRERLSKIDPRWAEGQDVFKSNCIGCHNVKGNGVGPALQGAVGRWHAAGSYQGKTGDQWMKIWIRNWHDAVDAKYKYAVNMANSRPQKMNIFVGMTDEKIDDIFLYVGAPDGLDPATVKK